jgi:hypothetical protein
VNDVVRWLSRSREVLVMARIPRACQPLVFALMAMVFWSWVLFWGLIHGGTNCPRRPPPPQIVTASAIAAPDIVLEEPPSLRSAPDENQLREAVRAAAPAIKAGLSDTFQSSRMTIRLQVMADGLVSRVTFATISGALSRADQRAIERGLRRTSFPVHDQPYTAEFPLILARGAY